MCLITYSKKPLVADTDIPCYKLLVKTNDGRLISPFQEMEYKIGEVNSAVSTVKKPFTIHTATYIEGGYLHGYNIYMQILDLLVMQIFPYIQKVNCVYTKVIFPKVQNIIHLLYFYVVKICLLVMNIK